MQIRDSWNNVSGSFRALYRAVNGNKCNLFAGVGQGFRAPNLSDLTRFDAARTREFEVPSPGLKPEQYMTGEAGVKSDLGFLSGNLAYFYTDITSMIIRTPTGLTRGTGSAMEYEITKKNSGKGYVHGVELEAKTTLARQVTIEGAFTLMYGEIEGYPTSTASTVKEPLTRLMPPTGNLSVTWRPPTMPLRLIASGAAATHQDYLSSGDKRDTQRIPPGGTPSYYVFNLGAGYKFSRDAEATLMVNNLMNKDYRIHGSGVNEPGRSVLLAMTLQY
jgi:hemoglobin/transferrin/lactoferrin receptor protein